jgi:hypothetical protein
MTKKTTPPTDGSDPSTTTDRPRLRRRMLRVLTSADLNRVNGGRKRTENDNSLTRDPDCPTN